MKENLSWLCLNFVLQESWRNKVYFSFFEEGIESETALIFIALHR